MERREFVLKMVSSLISLYTVCLAVARCGSSSSSTPAPTGTGNCNNGGSVTYSNPGHAHTTVALTAAQLTAAVAGNYTLLTGSHSHTFTLSGADFATIAALSSVSKTDLEGDGHTITIIC